MDHTPLIGMNIYGIPAVSLINNQCVPSIIVTAKSHQNHMLCLNNKSSSSSSSVEG